MAEFDSRVGGFVIVIIAEPTSGEARAADVEMIAVDPDMQRRGIGRNLLDAAVATMRESGCAYANVWTGGDEGHGSARALYGASGFTALPAVHYYRAL